MENRVPTRLSRAEARKFGFVLGGAFAALAGIVWWRGHASLLPVFAGIAGVLIVLAVAWPVALRPVHRAWMAFGLQLSRITTPIFMGLVYFLAVLPASSYVDLELVSRHVGGPVRVADTEELAEVFPDCEWGVASPFGNEYGLPTYLDEALAADALLHGLGLCVGERQHCVLALRATRLTAIDQSGATATSQLDPTSRVAVTT